MKIYMVEGRTGEYSDAIDWPVKAFRDEEKAKEFVLLVSARSREIAQWMINNDKGFYDFVGRDLPKEVKNEYDKEMYIDYSYANYTYYPVELEE